MSLPSTSSVMACPTKKDMDYTPAGCWLNQLGELMDALGLPKRAPVGRVARWLGVRRFSLRKHPERVGRLMLNTAGGLPVVSTKGQADLKNLIELNERNINNTPTYESVQRADRTG
jgi:HOMODA hydrolase